MDIEQLKELENGKTYYLRVSKYTLTSEIVELGDNIQSLNLGCTIIVGRGQFDIEECDDVTGDDWRTVQ